MSSGRTTFLAGIILGGSLGFTAGSVWLWHRGGERDQTLQPLTSPYYGWDSRGGLDSPGFEEPEMLPDFAEQAAPLSNALAEESSPSRVPSVSPSRRDGSAQPGEQPQPLTVSEATPIGEHVSEREEAIRELIENELKSIPAAQQDVWFESLRDLEREDVANVLRMWKRFGAPLEGLSPTIDPHPELRERDSSRSGSPPPHQVRTAPANAGAAVIARAKQMRLRNIAHGATPGFKRLIPLFIDRPESPLDGLETAISRLDVRVDLTPGAYVPTHNPLDWSIDGEGFFMVSDGERTYYTRCGRWTLDDERRIVMAGSDPRLRLMGEWTIPSSATRIMVSAAGVVRVSLTGEQTNAEQGNAQGAETPNTGPATANERDLGKLQVALFLNPAGLKALPNALFQATPLSGDAQLAAPLQGERGALRQGVLELSNVDVDEEYLALDDLDALESEQRVERSK